MSEKLSVSSEFLKDGDYIVDLHIHSAHSHEKICEETVREYLKRAQKFAEDNHVKVVMSITDHDSIFGSQKALKLINDNKQAYKDVTVISGIEINTNLNELNEFVDNKRVKYKSCHMLAYNYDVNNKDMIAYSVLAHLKEGHIKGKQLIAFKNVLSSKYGYNLSCSDLLDLYKCCKAQDYKEFIKKVVSYIQERRPDISEQDLKDTIGKYLLYDLSADSISRLSVLAKLSLSEVCEMVNTAGGEMVIAHPSFMDIKKYKGKFIIGENPTHFLKLLENRQRTYSGRIEKKLKLVDKTIELMQKVTNNAIVGIEAFNPQQFVDGSLLGYIKLAKKYNLYLTAGSDCHGRTKEKKYDQLLKPICDEYYEILNLNNENIKETLLNYITDLPICEHFISGKDCENKQQYTMKNKYKGIILKNTFSNTVQEISYKQYIKNNFARLLSQNNNFDKSITIKNLINNMQKNVDNNLELWYLIYR